MYCFALLLSEVVILKAIEQIFSNVLCWQTNTLQMYKTFLKNQRSNRFKFKIISNKTG